MLGLRGLVIKSHGSAEAYGFEWAIKRGYDAVKNGVLERLVRAMEENAAPIQQAALDARANGHRSNPANPAGPLPDGVAASRPMPGEPGAALPSKA